MRGDSEARLENVRYVLERVRQGVPQLIGDILQEMAASCGADAALICHVTDQIALVAYSTDVQWLGTQLQTPVQSSLRKLGFAQVAVDAIPASHGIWAVARLSRSTPQSPMPPATRAGVESLGLVLDSLHDADGAAHTDALTNLPDRAATLHRLRETIAGATRGATTAALLFLDLDNFKSINDTYGHPRGDALLRSLAQSMRAMLRGGEFIGRIGGDEFCVLLPVVENVSDVTVAASRLCEVVTQTNEGISLSIGIALIPQHGKNEELVMARADAAMYRAKRSGTCYCVYDKDWTADIEPEQAAQQSAPGSARGLVPSFQPIFDTRSNRVVGAEMFPRLPLDPLSTGDGTSGALDTWMLAQALHFSGRWHAFGVDRLHVNVRLNDTGDLTNIRRVLNGASAAQLSNLSLEMQNSGSANDVLAEALKSLQSTHVRVGLDGFERSRLRIDELSQWNPDFIKLSLARNSALGGMRSLKRLAAVARALEWTVIATHVENVNDREMLAGLGVPLMQGFALAHPMTSLDFEQWLKFRTSIGFRTRPE